MNKKLLMFVIPLLTIALVSAIGYYALFSVNYNIIQPISIEGDGEQSIDCTAGESCLGDTITITNGNESSKTVNIEDDNNNTDMEVKYVNTLELTKKDTSWDAVGEPIEIVYTVVGDNFEVSGVPEGYTLIYYKDNEANSDDEDRLVTIGAIGNVTENLPHADDWNVGELADYCDNANGYDDYEHCQGAKLWAVPSGDIVAGALTWTNMSNYYFETDLIYFFANSEGEVTVPGNSYLDVIPQLVVDEFATGGEGTFNVEVN